jgi:hypothetical protein
MKDEMREEIISDQSINKKINWGLSLMYIIIETQVDPNDLDNLVDIVTPKRGFMFYGGGADDVCDVYNDFLYENSLLPDVMSGAKRVLKIAEHYDFKYYFELKVRDSKPLWRQIPCREIECYDILCSPRENINERHVKYTTFLRENNACPDKTCD